MAPLRDFRFLQVGRGPVVDRAGHLLGLLGADVVTTEADPVVAHGHHGILDGTGTVPAGPSVVSVEPLAVGAVVDGLRAATAVVELLSALGGRRVTVDGPGLAAERAQLLGLPPGGTTTAGGAGRMVRAADGWVAVNLPRPSDLDLIEAWLGRPPGSDLWRTVATAASSHRAVGLVAAAQELGLAVALVTSPREAAADAQARSRDQPFPMRPILGELAPDSTATAVESGARTDGPRPLTGARVVDLSSLWAGPLATSLLADAGAEVVKVESTRRPDGARSGHPGFFDLLNAGKRSVALDLPDAAAVAELQRLVDGADLVVEASRPRALDQLGILRHDRWLSLTAYGATGPWRQWSGFGDDAAVAGGLVGGTPESPTFFGDAVADPLAGLHAAVAGLAVLVGAPARVDLALREVVNHVVGDAAPGPVPAARSPRQRRGAAPALGEANRELLGDAATVRR